VYDTGEDILADPALSVDEDAEVGGGHLDGLVEGHQQLGVIANDTVS
jgi:hypothetical protein